jgi:NodT family efflux transporter outer membrane factor (OMF) lipoprotein
MKIKKIFIYILIITIFIGCVPKTSKVEKIDEAKVLEELNLLETHNIAQGITKAWWEAFGDSQLNFLVSKALSKSYSLKSIEQRFAKANATIKAVESRNLPNISFESTITRQRFSQNHIFPPPLGGGVFTEYHSAVTLDYKFDFWDERKSMILSAKNLAFAQRAFIEDSKLNLSLAVTELYLAWNYNEKKLEILEKIIETLIEEEKILKDMYKSGLSDEKKVNEKEAQISKLRFSEYSIKEIINGQKTAIAILSGQLPTFIETLKKPQIDELVNLDIPQDIYLNFLSKRADVVVLKYIVESYNQDINVAKAKFYPNINLTALLGFTSFLTDRFLHSSSQVPSAGLALDLPIFDWGRREANLEDKVINYNSAVYEYSDTLNKAVNEVFGVLKKIEDKNMQFKMHEKELESTLANEKIEDKRFKAGLNNKVFYYDSKIDTLMLHLSKIELVESQAKLQLELIKAVGGSFKEGDINSKMQSDIKDDKN